MLDSGAADSEADESGPHADPRHVHRAVLDRILPGAETVHNLQPGVPGGRVPDLQQWRRQLHLLEQLRGTHLREWLRPRSIRAPPVFDGQGRRQEPGNPCVTSIFIRYYSAT